MRRNFSVQNWNNQDNLQKIFFKTP